LFLKKKNKKREVLIIQYNPELHTIFQQVAA